MSKKTTKNTHGGLKILATAAAIAAGGYFLYGKDAAKNRKRVKGWMLKVKGEVLDEIEKLKEIDEERYHKIVDNVVGKYKMAKDADKKELEGIIKELKGHWDSISRNFKATPKKTIKKPATNHSAKVALKKAQK
ncbi:MAG: hypothetical protein COZ49_01395 [Candidatus Yonathbacteria bacterium CG_4_10_14_3_um_filter_47_65]|uniref:Uncharacterized protein n=2 Tax=Parcubacteria group TaxID=1794811 RepID=A0A2M8D6X9_9BACT|nr:MAG: hypothetical protein AUJ44_03550 [Candidatus Nomurabacteria bacterium CG1_02_47_685]PIP04090.1 MAG: hypothetical protein COX54_00915 [Candidatus Yonathbacteria bacterium CG23_combo_of_CG06-09_8_20_14_all_46_18]PIQ30963.1 MAG: hypothetical protein COW61_04480 [Candidatus Yonathbacteria bacterium CG17_big_fil_post_rev_8_21_14_2_50_46_19]PIX56618.1 MAG: hypothetical protein COZ49_01395 [Candidatus Yonathbacteria bacterium CG_4_10_14_3_um_filter_47_65]PIY57254.1 MAG: hypothetical protein CO